MEIKRYLIDSDILIDYLRGFSETRDFLLKLFEIVPLQENLAKEAGEIRMEYQLPFADAIIAASAVKTQSFLVTKNIKHFSKVKNLKLVFLNKP